MTSRRKQSKLNWVYRPKKAPRHLIDIDTNAVDAACTWIAIIRFPREAVCWDVEPAYLHPQYRPDGEPRTFFMNEKELPKWIRVRLAILRMAPKKLRIPTIGTSWSDTLFTLEVGFIK